MMNTIEISELYYTQFDSFMQWERKSLPLYNITPLVINTHHPLISVWLHDPTFRNWIETGIGTYVNEASLDLNPKIAT